MPHTHDPNKKPRFKDLDRRQPPPAPPSARGLVQPGAGFAEQSAALAPPQVPPRADKPALKPKPAMKPKPALEPQPSSSSSSSMPMPAAASSSSMAGPGPRTPELVAQQMQEARSANYSHVDVSTALMKLGDDGAKFDGASAREYEEVKARLEEKGGPVQDRDVRFAMMKARVEQASQRRDEGEDSASRMGLFTAPEWALGKALTEEDVAWYREQFTGLSAEHPHMAMAPGTMLWQERVKSGLGHKTKTHNTGDVYHAGQLVHSVNKRGGSGDDKGVDSRHGKGGRVDKDRAAKWYERGRGDAQGSSLFEIGGVRMGYDICVDSDDQRVREELNAKGAPEGVDLHLVNSAGMGLQPNKIAMREGGVAVQNDADKGTSAVGVAQQGWDARNRQPVVRPKDAQHKGGDLVPGNMLSTVPMARSDTRLDERAPFDPRFQREHRGRFALR